VTIQSYSAFEERPDQRTASSNVFHYSHMRWIPECPIAYWHHLTEFIFMGWPGNLLCSVDLKG